MPVINENDTTATDEITFGDNDFLSAQVALLLGARQLVLLTDTAGVHTADPRQDPDARLIEQVDDFAELGGLRDRRPDVAVRLGRDAQQGGSRGDGDRRRDRGRGLRRDRGGHAAPRRRRRGRWDAVPGASGAGAQLQAVAALREAEPGHGGGRRRGGARAARAGLEPAAGGITGVEGEFEAGDAVDVVCDGERVGKGIVNYSADELGRIKGLKSIAVQELMPHAAEEAVHRDFFVLA